MYCLKCGKEAEDNRVFCAHCLEVMEAYPVKQGVAIQLPNRLAPVPAKKVSRRQRAIPLEEQVSRLKKSVRVLAVLLLVVSTLLCVTASMLLIPERPDETPAPGKEYTSQPQD